jgi:N-acetylmuramoyl-L-alanine amidase
MKICLYPGAYGNGLRESDITFNIVKYMGEILLEQGHGVLLTREGDVSPKNTTNQRDSLRARYTMPSQWKADVFVSIHINSASTSKASGCECYYYSYSGLEVAQ